MDAAETLAHLATLADVAARQLAVAERLELDGRAALLETVAALLESMAALLAPPVGPGGGAQLRSAATLVAAVFARYAAMAAEVESELRIRSRLAAPLAVVRR